MKKVFCLSWRKKTSETESEISPDNELKEKDFSKVHKAAYDGDVVELQQLAKTNDLNKPDKKNRTALHVACIRGNEKVVQFLVENKVQLNRCDNQKRSALMKAVQYQQLKCVSILLSHHAHVGLVDIDGNTVLHLASCYPSMPVMLQLLTCSTNINTQNKDGNSPLMLAAKHQRLDLVELLIDIGAEVNMLNYQQQSSLMFAAASGNIKLVQLLLDHGAEVLLLDKSGRSAVGFALNKKHFPCANLLSDYGSKKKQLKTGAGNIMDNPETRSFQELQDRDSSDGKTDVSPITVSEMVLPESGFITPKLDSIVSKSGKLTKNCTVIPPVLPQKYYQPHQQKSPDSSFRKQEIGKISPVPTAGLLPEIDTADVGVKVIMQQVNHQHQPAEHKQRSELSAQPDSIQPLSQRLKVPEPHPYILQEEQNRARLSNTRSEHSTNSQDEEEDSTSDSESDLDSVRGNEDSRGMVLTTLHHQAMPADPDSTTGQVCYTDKDLETCVTQPVVKKIQLQKSDPKTQRRAKSKSKEKLSPPPRNVQIHSSSPRKLVHQAVQTVDIYTHKREEAWTQTEAMDKILHNSAEYKAMQQKLKQMQMKNVSLRRELNNANGQYAAKQGAYEELQERFTCTLKRLLAEEEKRVQLDKERSKVLKEEKAKLQHLNSTLKGELAEREVFVRKLQQDLTEFHKKLSMCEASLDVSTHQCSGLQKERDAFLKDLERLRGKLHDREEQHFQEETCRAEHMKHLKEAFRSMHIENNCLKATVQQLTTSVKQLQDVLKAAATQAAAHQVQEEKMVAVGSTGGELKQNPQNYSLKGLTGVDKNVYQFNTEIDYIRQRCSDVDRLTGYARILDSKFNKVKKAACRDQEQTAERENAKQILSGLHVSNVKDILFTIMQNQ